MDVSETFFSRYAALSSFVIADEVLYQISDRQNGGNRLQAAGLQFGLHPSGSLAEIERFEKERARSAIFQFKKDYVATAVQEEIRSREQMSDYASATNTVRFIMTDVLPLMIDTARDLGELLHIDVQDKRTGREVIESMIEAEIGRAKGKKHDPAEIRRALEANMPADEGAIWRPDGSPESILGSVTGRRTLYVAGSNAMLLREGMPERADDLAFILNSRFYVPHEAKGVSTIEQRYSSAWLNMLKREAIGEFEIQIAEEVSKQGTAQGAFDKFATKTEFSYGNLGYERQDTQFYVYWEMPKFAMQNPLRTQVYHPFPPAKVAIPLNTSRGRIHHGSDSYILNKMTHPFLPDWNNGHQHICIMSGQDYGDSPAEIVRHLSTAINAFTNGLTLESLDAHGSRSETAKYFSHSLEDCFKVTGEMTREEALAQGYKIRNEWDLQHRQDLKTK